MFKKYLSICIILLTTIALSSNAQSNRSVNPSHSQNNLNTACFSPPNIPVMLRASTEKLNFLAIHWWDNFAFDQTDCIQQTKIAEKAFLDFINICASVDKELKTQAIQKLMLSTQVDKSREIYQYFFLLAEKYLYDPNSPFRNEEMYAIYLNYVLTDNTLTQTEKLKPQLHLKDINKNRVGSKAADFEYITSKGIKNQLYNLKTDYILIYFNNPDCEDCKRSSNALKKSKSINKLIEEGKLTLLSVYVDEDIELWKKYQKNIPTNWIDARDGSSNYQIQNQLYAIRAIPSLYLLDKDKKVILKDVDIQDVEEVLN